MNQPEILPAPQIEAPIPAEASKWEREKQAFRLLLPSLLLDHRGQYVAIHDGQVVGSGPDQIALARDAYRRFGYVPIYVGLVTDQPARVMRFRSRHVTF